MCCCKPKNTISIEVWPHLTGDDNFTSVIREAIRQAEIKFDCSGGTEVQYVGSTYKKDPAFHGWLLVHRFTATALEIQ